MIATKLKTNYLSKPMGIDPGTVVLTWISAEGIRHSVSGPGMFDDAGNGSTVGKD